MYLFSVLISFLCCVCPAHFYPTAIGIRPEEFEFFQRRMAKEKTKLRWNSEKNDVDGILKSLEEAIVSEIKREQADGSSGAGRTRFSYDSPGTQSRQQPSDDVGLHERIPRDEVQVGVSAHTAGKVKVEEFPRTKILTTMKEKENSVEPKKTSELVKTIVFHVLILCVLIMMAFISWPCALITLGLLALVAVYNKLMKPKDKNETSKSSGPLFGKVLEFIHQDEMEHYRPQILVLTGNPASRESLVHFVHNITQGKSLMMCGYIIDAPVSDRIFAKEEKIQRHFKNWMQEREIDAFLTTVANPSFMEGAAVLLQAAGVGFLRPNILMMGFKTNWDTLGRDNMGIVNDFYGTVDLAFAKNIALCVFRNSSAGLDMTDEMRKLKMNEEDLDVENSETINKGSGIQMKTRLYKQNGEKNARTPTSILKSKVAKVADLESGVNGDEKGGDRNRFKYSAHMHPAQHELMVTVSKFKTPVANGRIDIWWLQDNGGLAVLIPYLLTQRNSYLQGATLRVFTPSSSDYKKVSISQQNMTTTLGKFGVEASNVHIIDSVDKAPTSETRREFDELIAPFTSSDKSSRPTGFTSPEEINACSDRTMKQLRIAELMRENSKDADLIVVSLPVTRQQEISSSLYLSWLDMMSRGLPPTLMVRGNQTNVGAYFD